jgi:hypothetical protein
MSHRDVSKAAEWFHQSGDGTVPTLQVKHVNIPELRVFATEPVL